MLENILVKLLTIPGAVFAFSMEGFAKAFVSDKLGDPTPRNNNKVTLNPMAHIDLVGFIFIILFHFGWGKEVPMNPAFYKKYKRDNALVSLSGPVFLILSGFVFTFVYWLLIRLFYSFSVNDIIISVIEIFMYAASLCISLANFYLLPLPGLDGYKFIKTFTPRSWDKVLHKIEAYSLFIFIGFILLLDLTPIGDILFYPSKLLLSAFSALWNLILF